MFGFDSTYILLHRVCLWVNLAYKDRTPWMLAKMLGFDQWPTFVIDTNSDFSWADNHQVSVTPNWCHCIVVVWSLKTRPWFRFTQLIFKTSTHPRTHTQYISVYWHISRIQIARKEPKYNHLKRTNPTQGHCNVSRLKTRRRPLHFWLENNSTPIYWLQRCTQLEHEVQWEFMMNSSSHLLKTHDFSHTLFIYIYIYILESLPTAKQYP